MISGISASGGWGTGVRACVARLGTWVLACSFVLFAFGSVQASFRLFDALEDEIVGPLGGQDGWVSLSGDNRIVVDPDDEFNQTLFVPSQSSIVRKSLLGEQVGIANGTVRMMFMRIRISNKQTFSVGVSGLTNPREFSDFAPEIGMANSAQNLDLRVWDDDDGNYEVVTYLAPNRWYNLWVRVDAVQDRYQLWMNDTPGAAATAADKLTTDEGDEIFGFRSGRSSDLFTFFIKTAGGSSGTNFGPVHFDDIYLELSSSLNLTNPAVPNSTAEVRGLVFGADKETLLWNALPWAEDYDLVRGDLLVLREMGGDFSLAVNSCLEGVVVDDSARDALTPGLGQGFFYLVRGSTDAGVTGSYDSGGDAQLAPRDPGIAASPGACP